MLTVKVDQTVPMHRLFCFTLDTEPRLLILSFSCSNLCLEFSDKQIKCVFDDNLQIIFASSL